MARFTCQRWRCGEERCGSRQERARTVKKAPSPRSHWVVLPVVGWCLSGGNSPSPELINLFLASHSHDPSVNPLMLILNPLLARSLCTHRWMLRRARISVTPWMKCCISGQDGRAAVIIKSLSGAEVNNPSSVTLSAPLPDSHTFHTSRCCRISDSAILSSYFSLSWFVNRNTS